MSSEEIHRFRPPQRKLGPILFLKPGNGDGHQKERRFFPEKPLLIDSRVDSATSSRQTRLALMSCQENHWYLYNISDSSAAVQYNRLPVKADRPCRLTSGDEIQLEEDRWLVDLEMQGTTMIRSMDLIQRIHHGGGGDLYRARWYRPHREDEVAVRILPETFGQDRVQVQRFLRAVPTAVQLVHPSIVRLRKAGRVRHTDRSVWYLAVEYMAGGSLRDRLKRQQGLPIRLADCKDLAIAVARALCAAQKHEIIHRNITTGCILFDENNQVKLGDFTLAKGEVLDTFYDITRGRLLPGDYLYQSPEILSGSSDVTIAADFYSLAVCLFEALAGSVPFDRDQSDASMIAAVSRTAWPLIREWNPEVPLAWQHLIAKNLSRDPDDRSSTAEELLNEIRSMPDQMDRRKF